MVWSTAVCKNVYEQEAIRLQPRGNIPKKLLVVLHVLKHFNRQYAVKCLINVEGVDVTGDNCHI
jgi:hypothetical protein